MTDPNIVQRDQCNGVTLACVNCQASLGEHHNVMCYAATVARAERRRSNGREAEQ